MGLDETEKRYVNNVIESAPLQLSKALAISNLLTTATRKILYELMENNAFELHETNPEEDPPIPLEELDYFYRRLRYENHFSVINAHAVTVEEEIRQAAAHDG